MSKKQVKKVTQYSKTAVKIATIAEEGINRTAVANRVAAVQEPLGKQPFTNRVKNRAKYSKLASKR